MGKKDKRRARIEVEEEEEEGGNDLMELGNLFADGSNETWLQSTGNEGWFDQQADSGANANRITASVPPSTNGHYDRRKLGNATAIAGAHFQQQQHKQQFNVHQHHSDEQSSKRERGRTRKKNEQTEDVDHAGGLNATWANGEEGTYWPPHGSNNINNLAGHNVGNEWAMNGMGAEAGHVWGTEQGTLYNTQVMPDVRGAGPSGGMIWNDPALDPRADLWAMGDQQHQDQRGHAAGMAKTQSWTGWVDPQQAQNPAPLNGKTPKVIVTSPSSVDAKTISSPKQHQQILSSFFGSLKHGQQGGKYGNVNEQGRKDNKGKRGRDEDKKNRGHKGQQKYSQQSSVWHEPDAIDEEDEDEGDESSDEYGDGGMSKHSMWMADASNGWDNPAFPMPSKAYALATQGLVPPTRRFKTEGYGADARFIESREALEPAMRALYSSERLARNRIHWLFDPQKDERVSSLLDWIQKMQYGLANLGLRKFLETRERGALFANADYHPDSSPDEPAFFWLVYDDVQRTMDQTLQESLVNYDPLTQVIVFVFLLSKTQNSMAIWRRKLTLPNNIRVTYLDFIQQTLAGLRRKYTIFIDENPEDAPPPEVQPSDGKKTKRKWFRWGRG